MTLVVSELLVERVDKLSRGYREVLVLMQGSQGVRVFLLLEMHVLLSFSISVEKGVDRLLESESLEAVGLAQLRELVGIKDQGEGCELGLVLGADACLGIRSEYGELLLLMKWHYHRQLPDEVEHLICLRAGFHVQ